MPYYYAPTYPNDLYQHIIFTGTADETYTLGNAYDTPGIRFVFKNTGTGNVTISTSQSQTIDGSASFLLSGHNSYVTVFSDGNNWLVLDSQTAQSGVANVNLAAQTATIAPTTLYAVPATGAGMYRVTVDLITTTAGSAGTVLATIGSNNGEAADSQATGTDDLTTLGKEISSTFTFYSAASENITYATTVASATGSPAYSLKCRVEFLG